MQPAPPLYSSEFYIKDMEGMKRRVHRLKERQQNRTQQRQGQYNNSNAPPLCRGPTKHKQTQSACHFLHALIHPNGYVLPNGYYTITVQVVNQQRQSSRKGNSSRQVQGSKRPGRPLRTNNDICSQPCLVYSYFSYSS